MSALVATHVPELELFEIETDAKRQRHLPVANKKFEDDREGKEMEETESESSEFEPENENESDLLDLIREDSSVRSKKKAVKFHETVKTWDGLRRFNCDFDELLFCFLVKGQSVGDGDVLQWTGEDCHRIFHMARLMSDLIARLRAEDPENKGESPVPCLPRGGGRAIRVERAYEPYLLSLLSVLVTALNSAVNSPRRRNFDLISSPEHKERLNHFLDNKSDMKALVLLDEKEKF